VGYPERIGADVTKGWPLWGLIAFLLLSSSMCTSAPTRSPRLSSPAATLTVLPDAGTPVGIYPTERWIEVSLSEQMVRLHDGDRVVGEYRAATGVGNTPETTTFPGLFMVRDMTRGPIQSAPDAYVSDVVEFDMEHGNAFHSLPMDASGHVLDKRLGQPVSAGCVRMALSEAVFDFAHIGMKVWVH